MGITLPQEEQNKQVPPEMADHIAIMAAEAAEQLFTQNSQEAQQQQAQQQMQPPVKKFTEDEEMKDMSSQAETA